MNPHLKKFLSLTSIIAILIGGRFALSSLGKVVEERVAQSIKSSGLRNSSITDLNFTPPVKLHIGELKFVLPVQKLSIPIVLSNSWIDLSPFELMLFRTTFSSSSSLFGGKLTSKLSQGFFSDRSMIRANVDGIKLSQISPLNTFGIDGNATGSLEFETKNISLRKVEPEIQNFHLNIEQISFRGGVIPGILFPLPQISDGQLKTSGYYRNGLPAGTAEASCNLGNFSAKITQDGVVGTMNLSPEGEEKYGAILAALSGKSDILDKKHWRFTISRDLKSVKVSPNTP